MVTLGALKEQTKLNNLPIHEIQIHLLDKDGDGIVLCLEYETSETGERINKTFYNTEEMYDEEFEVELEEEFGNSTDPCISPENVTARFEEAISEEYDEIFQERVTKKPSSLLN
jgi:hypothetical protein